MVTIKGVGITQFQKKSNDSLIEMMVEAASLACSNAGIEPDSLGQAIVGVMAPEGFTGQGNIAALFSDSFAQKTSSNPVPSIRVETASSTGAAVIHTGYKFALLDEKPILLVAGEKMSTLDMNDITAVISRVIEPESRSKDYTMKKLAGELAQLLLKDERNTMDDLDLISFKNHRNGKYNPRAHFQKGATLDDIKESRIVAYPLRIFHCAPVSDGAAAIVLAPGGDVQILGVGHGVDAMNYKDRKDPLEFLATKKAAQEAYAMAKIEPRDVKFAELHDAFVPFELLGAVACGLYDDLHSAVQALRKGELDYNGRLPVNTTGGLKAKGHPLAASGLAQIVDIVYQMRGKVNAEIQVKDPRIAVAHSIGGLANNNFVTILKRVE
ncbi:thiolase family protein [Candidatus Woesearchaeota archaeon]|nr:thiolase family protein [Candidatus Woesearchaeota archaeon]